MGVEAKRELLARITRADFEITHTRGSGPGGQHRNKTSTGRRIHHPPSGVTVEATDSRSAAENERNAFLRLIGTAEFKRWFRLLVAEAAGRPSIEQLVDEAMTERNIRTQVLDERGRWIDVDPASLTREEQS